MMNCDTGSIENLFNCHIILSMKVAVVINLTNNQFEFLIEILHKHTRQSLSFMSIFLKYFKVLVYLLIFNLFIYVRIFLLCTILFFIFLNLLLIGFFSDLFVILKNNGLFELWYWLILFFHFFLAQKFNGLPKALKQLIIDTIKIFILDQFV